MQVHGWYSKATGEVCLSLNPETARMLVTEFDAMRETGAWRLPPAAVQLRDQLRAALLDCPVAGV